jgi:hypothetical protein
MAHTTNDAMNASDEIFGEHVISQGLWPACSPDLSPCDFIVANKNKKSGVCF